MPNVFISYRREDSAAGYASWIYDRLTEKLGASHVFMDVDSLAPGVDFVEHLEQALAGADTALVLIGPAWLGTRDKHGNPRLEDPSDFVRLEVSAALRSGARVIPVLIGGAQMPEATALPDELAPLTRRQALTVHSGAAVKQLVDDIVAGDSGGAGQELPPAPPGYRIIDFLREDLWGHVYRAEHLGLQRRVALQIVSGDPQKAQRFLRQHRVVSSISHPGLIPSYDAGMYEHRAFVASALFEVRPLSELRDEAHRIDPARAGNLLAQVADALGAVHEHGVVHSDVNLVNILVADQGVPERAFITGFWTPPEVNAAATIAGFELPTLAYTAPEAARGEQLDGRADIYSLGCVLFHLLTGQRPFKDSEGLRVLWDHLQTPMPSVRELAPDIPSAYADVVHTATAKEPAERFQTAGELAAALRAAAQT
jgi:hypothetical protein